MKVIFLKKWSWGSAGDPTQDLTNTRQSCITELHCTSIRVNASMGTTFTLPHCGKVFLSSGERSSCGQQTESSCLTLGIVKISN